MRKLYLVILFLLLQFASIAQTSESEPNDDFNDANELLQSDPTTGSLGGGDTDDYHKLDFNYHGNFYLVLHTANTGNVTSTLNITIYNTLRINGVFVGNFYQGSVQLFPGGNFDDTLKVCGLAPDSLYLKLSSTGSIDYTIEWFPVNVFPEDGFNNTSGTATPFSFNTEKQGSIGYEFWGNVNVDTVDYFSSTLQAANYDSVQLNIRVQNNYCSGSKWIKYFCYKNGSTTPFASGYVGNNAAVNSYQEVYSHIPLTNMHQGDNLLVKFVSNGPFGYYFNYKYIDPYEDEENNCCIYNAKPLAEGVEAKGNVGEYDFNTSSFVDQFDTYRLTLPHDGTVKLFATAKNDECGEENYFLAYDILDKYGNELPVNGTILIWENFPACNVTKQDSIKLRGFSADTFYLRLRTDFGFTGIGGKISYSVHYQLIDSTGNIDPEPNGSIAQAIPVAVGQIKKGHVRFLKDAFNNDIRDYYKAVFPADGMVKVYLKTTYRSEDGGSVLQFNTSGYSGNSTPNPPLNYFQADSVYLDTLNICGTAGGDLYFELTSIVPYEYEFRYEIADTSTLDNDTEPNNSFTQATLTGGGVTKKGHINYVGNTGADNYDYYKMVFSSTDSLKLQLQGTNTSCQNNQTITYRLFNKTFSNIVTKTKSNVAAGQTVTDSIKIKVTAPDTIYLRVEATDAFKYQFSTNLRLPSSAFSISGDTAVCMTTEVYKAVNVADEPVTYNWSLPLGGGTLSFVDSIATVNWNATGNRSIQLYLSNALGNSQTKVRNIVVNGAPPSQVPVAFNFARTLSTNSLPPGATCQWYRNDTLIIGATGSSYYAANAGNYTVKFVNDCGPGPSSNIINFPAAALTQTITFPHTPTTMMTLNGKIVLPATASSGLPVFYQKLQGFGLLQNDTFYFSGNSVAGTIIFKAMQPGDDVYSPAADKFDTVIIIKGNQVISFDSIPGQVYDASKITLTATSSQGETISYIIASGSTYASVSGNKITKKGAGPVTVRALQNGNANYNAATPVDRTFCIGVRNITAITGDANPCLNTYRYLTQIIPGAQYVWTLSGGGTLSTNNDTAWVQWQTPGSYTLKVKANSACDPVYSNEQVLQIVTSNNIPVAVSNMLPANNATDQQLPLTLSWVPGANTINYDLYVWDSAVAQPVTPYAANISSFSYVIPKNGLAHNKTYKWKVVAKNPCAQTSSVIQQFRVIPLPDLEVSNVQAPAVATSGQTITVSWKVTNKGPGKTFTTDTWWDGVYFALDTVPNVFFNGSINWDATSWSSLTANFRPLLLGKKERPASLDSGQFYTNSLDFTLPLEYNFPVYVYVITDNQHPNWKILQASVANDTGRKQNPVIINLLPTPDLRVDSVFAPASAFSGSTININYKVKNYGVLTPAGSSWNDAVYISQSPLFDSSNAIRLKGVKFNGSYYPNAPDAGITVNTQLQHDSTYTRSLQAVIPNNIFGTWFIYVKTNNNKVLYEGALSNNNINQAPLQVYLTPTPKLTVSSLSLPVTNVSTTQAVGANWNIKNEGFRDNIEKNRGHYISMSLCAVRCPSGPPNSICPLPSVIKDSIVFGSSYWLDRVYLSTDSTGLNLGNAVLVKETEHGKQYGGFYFDQLPSFISCPALASGNIDIDNVIEPGSDFPVAGSFVVPPALLPGNYYVYVFTNPTKTVFEYPGTAQIRRSASALTVSRPDVTVSSISAPAVAVGGTTITINYAVQNNGQGTVFNQQRKDRFYISNFSSFDASAQLLATQTFTEDLQVGNAVPHSFTYNIPAASTGLKYFYVQTNHDSVFRETNPANNISVSAATSITAATAADLVVSLVQPKDTVMTISPTSFKYTVANAGGGTTAGTWTDSLFISCSPFFSAANSYFITKRTQSRQIAAGGNYIDSFTFTIPKMSYEINNCFPQAMYAPAYFYVKTNADNGTYEASAINNNVSGSGAKVILNPLIDHIVSSVTLSKDTITVGTDFTANWKVKNIGYNTLSYYHGYADGVFFSPDSVFNSNAVLAEGFYKYDYINRNDSLLVTKQVSPPNISTGDYYVFAKTNYSDNIPGEKVLTNNTALVRNAGGIAKKIRLVRPLLADLKDSVISATASVAPGQPVTIIYKVTNVGTGTTYPGSTWQNNLLLSTDFLAMPNDGDRLLATRLRNGQLLPGQSYLDTVTVNIPSTTVTGNYVLISKSNSNNVVVESNTTNNLGFSLLTVYDPPVTDLTVSKVLRPDTVTLGYTMDTAKWVVRNASAEEARGQSSDGIYLSAGEIFDSTAVLLGMKNKSINLAPLQSDTVRMAPLVKGVVEGNYNVFVKTDLLNNITESDKNNNTGQSLTPVYVKVKELQLNVNEANTLFKTERYYKLNIPDSLYGSTILLTLKTNDSLTMKNEMFTRAGYIPTAAHYDQRFEIPNYGNQQIVMTSVTQPVYYIMLRNVSVNPVVQNITLKAVKLPFAILSVQTNSGGNIGNVTVQIKGSLFRDSMTATLSNGVTTINASAVYFTNSTQVYATFNLQGKPLGIYNLTLTKPNAATAVLPNGFTIVPANNGGLITGGGVNTGSGNGNSPGCDPGAASGLNSQLVVDLVVPPSVLLKRPVVIQVHFTNPTNFDIPAQSRILYSEAGMKMAFNKENVSNGSTSLYLELVEEGGPPGIIRAGGSGTITIYTKAPSTMPEPDHYVLFKLK